MKKMFIGAPIIVLALAFLAAVGYPKIDEAPLKSQKKGLEIVVKKESKTETSITKSLKELLYENVPEIERHIMVSSEKFNTPDYLNNIFLRAIINVESEDKPNAEGSSGERGYMQLTSDAWNQVEKEVSFKEAFDPKKNIEVGRKYLLWIDNYCKKHNKKWNNLSDDGKRKAIAASYNAGIIRMHDVFWNLEKAPRTTKEYIRRIEKAMKEFTP